MAQFARKPCSGSPEADNLEICRICIRDLEALLDTAGLRSLTENDVSSYEIKIREIIFVIRNTSHETTSNCIDARDAVLEDLRQVRDTLNLAYLLLEQKKKNNQYFKHLRSCRSWLEQALEHWEGPDD